MGNLSDEKKQQRMYLYNQGLSNKQIADICGTTPNAIAKWKERNGLNEEKTQPRIDDELCRKMFYDGKKDAEIAKANGVSVTAVISWRHRRGLQRRKRGGNHYAQRGDDQNAKEPTEEQKLRKENQKLISADVAAAKASGLSYGKYKAGYQPKERDERREGWEPMEVKIEYRRK